MGMNVKKEGETRPGEVAIKHAGCLQGLKTEGNTPRDKAVNELLDSLILHALAPSQDQEEKK